ncbi:hypothetical protein [Macrococcus brunensis]|uniref:hypothetical protein n=1 Tax=Macrococcus brunensis TaxID=198483 RepID=UPI001EF0E8A4|nr:hypothetical protein [Macrococcus brunensis]ULG71507.1 hypothetical protein MGG12_09250 [Macrococcus brunensis]
MNKSQKIAALLPIWLIMIVSYITMLHVIFDGGSLLRLTLAVLGFILIASLALLGAWTVYQDTKKANIKRHDDRLN